MLTDKGISMMGETSDAVFLKNINTNVLTEDPGKNLWVGTFGKGVFVKGSDQEYFEPFSGFPDYSLPKGLVVEAIYADQDGRIWVGTYGDGLYIIDPATSTISHQLPDKRNPFSLGFNYVLSIKPDSKGGVWVGTDGGGISYYNSHFHNFHLMSESNLPDEISIEQIRAIACDEEGVLWLGLTGKALQHSIRHKISLKLFLLNP